MAATQPDADKAAEKPSLRAHTNTEDIRQCPHCDKEVVARGLYAHVYNSDDAVHGPRDSVPEGFDVSDAEVVGSREITVRNPTEYSVDHRRVVCDYCDKTYRGAMGMKIHLGRKAGKDDAHPADAADRDPESFDSYPATDDGAIVVDTDAEAEALDAVDADVLVAEGDGSAEVLLDEAREAADAPAVPLSDLKALRDKFLDDDEQGRHMSAYHAAERVEQLIERHS
jgi:hypothetical protein